MELGLALRGAEIMSIYERIVEDATANGWMWASDNVLNHPADAELNIRRDAESGRAILSPKLVHLIEIENSLDSDY